MAVSTPRFSFVRLNDNAFELPLPAFGIYTEVFQFLVTGIPKTDSLYLSVLNDQTNVEVGFSTAPTVPCAMLADDGTNWTVGQAEAPADPLHASLGIGDYFRYLIKNAAGAIIARSNPFEVVAEDLFTSVMTYRCNGLAYGFTYSACDTDLRNRVRLPLYLLKPTHPKKRTVYRLADGSNRLISAQVSKEYQLITDQMPEIFHECLAIALSHEVITIENSNTRESTLQILEADDYKPAWPEEEDIDVAPGSCKVTVATFGYSANNCGTDDCGGGLTPCVKVEAAAAIVLPDGQAGQSYNYTFNLTGTPPFSFVDEGVPAWMTVGIVGSTVVVGGTPTDAGDVDVPFSIENCNGNANFISISQTITIAP